MKYLTQIWKVIIYILLMVNNMSAFLNSIMQYTDEILKYKKINLTQDLSIIKKGVIGDEVDYSELAQAIKTNEEYYHYYSFPLILDKKSYLINKSNKTYFVSNKYIKVLKEIILNDSQKTISITSNYSDFSFDFVLPKQFDITISLNNITVDNQLYTYNYLVNNNEAISLSNLKMILYVYSSCFKEKEIKRLEIDFSYLKTESSGGI